MLVIEDGYSKLIDGLKMAMGWWFAASKHQVKLILLAKFDEGIITLEK